MEMLAHYKEREQAYIKHLLLEAYLERFFMIVGQHHKTICYVDCFVSPWEENREDLMDTSIGISLELMARCKLALAKIGYQINFRALFVGKKYQLTNLRNS